jgi:hypothetical protein
LALGYFLNLLTKKQIFDIISCWLPNPNFGAKTSAKEKAMTEPAREPDGTPTLEETALDILRQILKAYGLQEDEEGEEGKKGEEHDYRIRVIDGDHVITLDIDADEEIRGILIGKEDSNLQAMQRIFIGAMHRRLGHDQGPHKFERFVRLAVNGKLPEMRRENGDRKRTDDERRRRPSNGTPVVVITYPPGVEIRTRVASE